MNLRKFTVTIRLTRLIKGVKGKKGMFLNFSADFKRSSNSVIEECSSKKTVNGIEKDSLFALDALIYQLML